MCQSPGSLPSVPKSFDSKRISLPWIHTWCVWVRRHSVRLVEIPSFHRLIWGSEMKTCLKGSDKTITTIRKRSEMRKRWAQRMYHNAKALYSSLLDMRSKEIQPHVLVHDPSTKFKIQPFKQIWARAGLPKVCLATPPRQQTYLHARTCSHHFAPRSRLLSVCSSAWLPRRSRLPSRSKGTCQPSSFMSNAPLFLGFPKDSKTTYIESASSQPLKTKQSVYI